MTRINKPKIDFENQSSNVSSPINGELSLFTKDDDNVYKINNSGTVNRVGLKTNELDISGQTSVTVSGADNVLIADSSDNNNIKKTSTQSIADLSGIWTEDSNSPHNLSGDTSYKLNIADNRDLIQIFIANVSISRSAQPDFNLRVNADTGGNYTYFKADGSTTSSASEFTITDRLDGNDSNGIINLSGRWENNIGVTSDVGMANGSGLSTGVNTNISSPLNSITLFNKNTNDNFSANVEILGRDIG